MKSSPNRSTYLDRVGVCHIRKKILSFRDLYFIAAFLFRPETIEGSQKLQLDPNGTFLGYPYPFGMDPVRTFYRFLVPV